MSSGVIEPPVLVRADSSTLSQRTARRWHRWRWGLIVGGGVLLVALLGALLVPRTSSGTRLDPDNAGPNGARAVAQILDGQGVQVSRVTRIADAADAPQDATLVIVDPALLGPEHLRLLASGRASLVLVEPDAITLGILAPSMRPAGSVDAQTLEPLCSVPAAEAAGAARAGGRLYRAPQALTCYVQPDGAASYVRAEVGARTVVVIGQGDLLTNAHLAQDGNAALALWTLGEKRSLVWYVPDPLELSAGQAPPTVGELLPEATWWVVVQLLVVTVLALVWRGRRLGRLVSEPMPVVVRAAETQEGRARLYRAARARDRAAATLRTAAVRRLARRLRVPPDASPGDVIPLVVDASGWHPAQVEATLLGPAPDDDAALVRLASALDSLERAVSTVPPPGSSATSAAASATPDAR